MIILIITIIILTIIFLNTQKENFTLNPKNHRAIKNKIPIKSYEYKGQIDRIEGEYNGSDISRFKYNLSSEDNILDESNNDILDGDERISANSLSRNDNVAVIAGSMKRTSDLDKYMREEVEQEEDSRWWGNNEY